MWADNLFTEFEGTRQQYLLGHKQPVSALEYSPDGYWLASGSGDGSVKIWQVAADSEGYVFERSLDGGHTMGVSDIAWSSDSKFICSASDDKTIRSQLCKCDAGRDSAGVEWSF
jgi:WD40 repeat protein